jgi:hypothetical protein
MVTDKATDELTPCATAVSEQTENPAPVNAPAIGYAIGQLFDPMRK